MICGVSLDVVFKALWMFCAIPFDFMKSVTFFGDRMVLLAVCFLTEQSTFRDLEEHGMKQF